MEIDAIVVLSAGIKHGEDGRWVSTDLTEADNILGAPGGKLRVIASAILSNRHPNAVVVANGEKGLDIASSVSKDRPTLAEITREELIENGLPEERIILEKNSNTTYQQLQELEKMVIKRKWRNILIVTNRYHVARVKAMIGMKFPKLVAIVKVISAEEVVIYENSAKWENAIIEAYASDYMKERTAREEQGILQITNSTYRYV